MPVESRLDWAFFWNYGRVQARMLAPTYGLLFDNELLSQSI